MNSRFIVTAETTENFLPVSNITFPIIQEYCNRHGYEFRPKLVANPERDSIWERVKNLQDALKDSDWAVHIDADCLLTNHHIPLTEFIENDKSIVISCAPYQGKPIFNDGFFMVHNCGAGKEILEESWVYHNPEEGLFCAQDAFWLFYKEELMPKYWFSVQPQKRFNSFLWKEYSEPESTQGNWTPGDFILHLPGMNTEKRVELLNHYKEYILR